MTWKLALACRLAKACDVAYYVDRPGGVTACPSYGDARFTDVPDVAISGVDRTDAGLVGSCADCVIVAFRGTLPLSFDSGSAFFQSLLDWLNDAKAAPVPGYGGLVHGGFAASLANLWPTMEPSIRARAGAGTPIYVTGHSKGGALATLAAIRLHDEAGLPPAAIYTYAAPRAGNGAFAGHYGQVIGEHWRVENRDDVVPHLPPGGELGPLLRRLDPRFGRLALPEYESVGTLQFINWSGAIVGNSLPLRLHRLESLTEKLGTGQPQVIVGDHTLTRDYFAAVCG